ncbi:inactive receptor kinase [Spatholobus suberectus]|nr:inactive receptor kinase [Spatholobus suberectus]
MGTSYKAILEDGVDYIVVVKRLKDVVVMKKGFVMQMEAIGKIKHKNMVLLRVFYYSRDEKVPQRRRIGNEKETHRGRDGALV